jgi:hypothetical protein
MNKFHGALIAVAGCALPWAAAAQDTASPTAMAESPQLAAVPAQPAEPAPSMVQIPAGTPIVVEFSEALSSRTTQMGYLFALRLAEPIIINDEIAVPAGAVGGGEVIDAHRSGMGGRQGVLTLSGRFIEVGGQRIRIRGMQVLAAGEDNTREAVNTTLIVGGAVGATIGLLIQGGEVEIPVGARANAIIATAFDTPQPAIAREFVEASPAPIATEAVESTAGEPHQ